MVTRRARSRMVRVTCARGMRRKMKGLSGDEPNDEVKSADRILQREDVSVSPLERRKFVQEMIADTFSATDRLTCCCKTTRSISRTPCATASTIRTPWIERSGLIERAGPTCRSLTTQVPPGERQDRVERRSARETKPSPMVDARLPGRLPRQRHHPAARHPRRGAHHPEVRRRPLHRQGPHQLRHLHARPRDGHGGRDRARLNILVSGGTGSGKTTNLNVLSSFIPDGERVITIEDSAELQLQQPHVINLEARPANAEGQGEVRIRDLVKNALRMRPDRIIVGECRSGEALDMLQAMNTGHEGSMTTVHANTARDALSRLETMVLMAGFDLPVKAIREQVASALDLIMQVDRMPDGRRVVTSLTELQGLEGETILLQDIFKYRFTPGTERGKPAGELVATGLRPKFMEKLIEREIDLPASAFKPPTPTRPTPRASSPAGARARSLRDRRAGTAALNSSTLLAALLVGGGFALHSSWGCSLGSTPARNSSRTSSTCRTANRTSTSRSPTSPEQHPGLVENLSGLAGRWVDSFDERGSLLTKLERARLPLRPGEYVMIVVAGAVVLGALGAAIGSRWFIRVVGPTLIRSANLYLERRVTKRRKKFELSSPRR